MGVGVQCAVLTVVASCSLGSSCVDSGPPPPIVPRRFQAASTHGEPNVPVAPPSVPRRRASLAVDCRAKAVPVSPLIYGIAYDPQHDAEHTHQWQLGATVRRWGGNPSSRYNWALGNAWNAAQDWYWENVDYTPKRSPAYRHFLDDDLSHGVKSALTVPILGWVAKDTSSYSFPVAAAGAQDAVDPFKPDAGNGLRGKKPLPSPPPSRTSVPAPPEFIKRWIETIRAEDLKRGARSVHQYILDNEPNLWSSTHRDVHPEPLSYDELLDRTIQYGTAIRAADPDAVIAGPAEWGYPNYHYSAQDLASRVHRNADRRAHGDIPLIPWYLQKLRAHEQKTGVRVLDVLDLHFYPQGERIYGPDDAGERAALRIRSTRGLWDPAWVDESWINDKIALLPTMRRWIAENYPGRGISVGEWNFGGERHMSGGLATAEALGRFAQFEVTSAFYWAYPEANTPSFWAFRAYRNFDGKGGRFLDLFVPTKMDAETSFFASRDESGKHLVAVVLNFTPDRAADAEIDLSSCGVVQSARELTYTKGTEGFVPGKVTADRGTLRAELAPYSITVLDLEVANSP
jgi:hypothetical protein